MFLAGAKQNAQCTLLRIQHTTFTCETTFLEMMNSLETEFRGSRDSERLGRKTGGNFPLSEVCRWLARIGLAHADRPNPAPPVLVPSKSIPHQPTLFSYPTVKLLKPSYNIGTYSYCICDNKLSVSGCP